MGVQDGHNEGAVAQASEATCMYVICLLAVVNKYGCIYCMQLVFKGY